MLKLYYAVFENSSIHEFIDIIYIGLQIYNWHFSNYIRQVYFNNGLKFNNFLFKMEKKTYVP